MSRWRRHEEAVARRRMAEEDRREQWSAASRYFQTWDMQVCKYDAWLSSPCPASPRDAEEEAHRKAKDLDQRKKRLREMLAIEDQCYAEELAVRRQAQARPVSADLKLVEIELKRKEEESRRRDAEIRRYLQWRRQQPLIRQFETHQHKQFVKQAWVEQIKEKELEREKLEKIKEEEIRKQAEALEDAIKHDEEKKKLHKQRAEELQMQIAKQIEEIQEKRRKTEELLKEAETTRKKQAELDDILEKKRQVEHKRKNIEHGIFLRRQCRQKLRQQIKKYHDSIIEDKQLLEKLLIEEQEDKLRTKEMKEKARKEMLAVQECIKEQSNITKEREMYLEFLFDEEARQMWEKMDSQWKDEEISRNRLMTQVLQTQRDQLSKRLAENLEEQQKLIESRDILIKEVQEASQQMKREKELTEKTKQSQKLFLDAQVQDKCSRLLAELKLEELESEKRKQELEAEEFKLFKELKRMNEEGYKTKRSQHFFPW